MVLEFIDVFATKERREPAAEKQMKIVWHSSTYWYSVYCYGTYLYLTYYWSTSHFFPCVPIFPRPPILQSVMSSLVIVYKLTTTTITSSFTSCDATILTLAVGSRSLSTISARMCCK